MLAFEEMVQCFDQIAVEGSFVGVYICVIEPSEVKEQGQVKPR